MSADDDSAVPALSDGDPQTVRYPCPWCELPDMWPDQCVEEGSDGRPSEAFRCAEMIEKHCARENDHRRCRVGACVVSTRWHDAVRLAGMVAARALGRVWAVVSTVHARVELAGTADEVEQAERVRYQTLVNAGCQHDPEKRWQVYIVRGSDGGFM